MLPFLLLPMFLLTSSCSGLYDFFADITETNPIGFIMGTPEPNPSELILDFEDRLFSGHLFRGALFANNIAVTYTDIPMGEYAMEYNVHAGALFTVDNPKVLYGHNLFEPLYPASLTKIMTAIIALRYGDLEDMVTISEEAVDFNWYAQVGGLRAGDQVSLYDLMGGLLLHSGNDNAIAIAEHISGSEREFVFLMNQEAYRLGASHTNFTNSHGLHDENQYSTLYDMYLIFAAAIRNQYFLDFIKMPYIMADITDVYGNIRQEQWFPSNWYTANMIVEPDTVRVLGGKTGTTDEAGACVILYNKCIHGDVFISIIMGAPTREDLYNNMTALLSYGIGVQ